MKVIKEEVYCDDNEFYKKRFYFDDNFQLGSIIELAKAYESDDIIFDECWCNTFSEEGHAYEHIFRSIEDIKAFDDFPNPSGSFTFEFCNKHTGKYEFQISVLTNNNTYIYSLNKKRKQLENSTT